MSNIQLQIATTRKLSDDNHTIPKFWVSEFIKMVCPLNKISFTKYMNTFICKNRYWNPSYD